MVALYMGACLHSSAQCPLSKWPPQPFMTLMMHYSASIASLASPDPIFHCFSDPRFGALSPGKLRVHPLKWRLFASYPPPHPLNSLRSVYKLKPSLSAGFRNITITITYLNWPLTPGANRMNSFNSSWRRLRAMGCGSKLLAVASNERNRRIGPPQLSWWPFSAGLKY